MASEKEVLDLSERYAEKAGFRLNPDQKVVEMVIQGLVRNEGRYGFRYCPCRIVTKDKENDRKIICPCAYHKDEIEALGYCHCLLFFTKA
jgi:ferredoxin-thioredoxin reductase catalytic chain